MLDKHRAFPSDKEEESATE